MEIKELRIGNIILFGNIEAEVLGTCGDAAIIKYNNKIEDVVIKLMLQAISPLGLSEDQLLRYGFALMSESEYTINTYELEGFQLWNKNGDFSEIVFLTNRDSVIVKSVHQLQNLFFALKGKELTIK
jgi:hypothetical protein